LYHVDEMEKVLIMLLGFGFEKELPFTELGSLVFLGPLGE